MSYFLHIYTAYYLENTCIDNYLLVRYPVFVIYYTLRLSLALQGVQTNSKGVIVMLFSVCACDQPLAPQFPFPLRGNFACCAQYARELGFDGIELQIQDPRKYDGAVLREIIDRTGLGVSAVTTGLAYTFEGMSMTDSDPVVRRATVNRLKQQLDLAGQLDSNILLGIIRGRLAPGETEEVFEAKLTESMWALLEHAEKVGTGVIFEHINRYDGDIYNSTDRTMRFIESFHSRCLFYNADTYHMLTDDPDPRQAVERSIGKLELFHVSGAGRELPDDAHFDFAAVAAKLKELRYSRWVTLECKPLPTSKEATCKGLAYLKRVFGQKE